MPAGTHRSPSRRLRTALAAAAVTPLATVGLVVAGAAQPALAAATGGQGATLAYTEIQAENAATNGTIIGPSYTYNTLPDEASGRKAVTLSGQGKYVEFTLPSSANSIDFRFSIPDTGSGSVYSAPISLYINGVKQPDITLTNAYSWYYGGYPFTNSPGSNAHHFYDEVHKLLPQMSQGTKVRLQVDSEDTAASYTIDFADFEQVAPAASQPANSLSITSFGADPSGNADSSSAFDQAISAAQAQGKTVWIPSGNFQVNRHILVNNVTIRGAGIWYSNVFGTGVGFYGNYSPASTNVHLSDFAITGNVQERCDGCQVNGIGGAMSDSTVTNVWIEHTKVGAWMDGPMDNLTFDRMRIRDQTADGINFHKGVTNSTVTNSEIRNTGDDGLAMWADAIADANNTFSFNTISLQTLANGIAIYGGHDNTVSDNRVVDTGLSQGGGIHVAQRFSSTPLGRTDVLRNTIVRSGSLDPNWQFGVGALWFDARDAAINTTINVDNIVIQQSPYEAFQVVSGSNVAHINLSNATITSVGTFLAQEQVAGSATFTNVVATQVFGPAMVYNCGVSSTITDGGGNTPLGTPYCGPWPTPNPPPPVGVSTTPTGLSFGSQTTGTTSAPQTVTLTNIGTSSVSVSGVSVTGDFSQSNTCGSSIGAGASCSVSVTFHPTATGNRTGALSISTSDPSSPTLVSLSGTGTAPGPAVNASPSSLSFGSLVVGQTSGSQAVTVTNSGTTSASISSISTTGDFAQSNNCGASLAVGASCTANVTFHPSAGGSRTGTLTIASNAVNSPTTVALSGSAIDSSTNVALGKPASASGSVNGAQLPDQAVDGDANTYWESANGAFPQWWEVDLGQSLSLGKVVIKLPPSTAWGTRTQTLSVLGSTNGSTFNTIVGSAGYTFNPNTNGNAVTIIFSPATARYLRLNFTANTGWAAAQASEVEVYPAGGGGGGGSASLSASPTSLSFASQTVGTTSAPKSVTVHNNGAAAASVSSVSASGDFSQTNNCGSSIAAGASCTVNVTFAPTATGTRTGTLTINSNATNSPTTVALSGTGGSSGGGTVDATSTIQAESFDAQSGTGPSGGVQTESTTDTGGGLDVGWITNGDWVRYDGVDFGSSGLAGISARVASGANASGTVELHLDSLNNPSVGSFTISPTGGWQNWTTVNAGINQITGTHSLFLKFVSSSGADFGNINWFTFTTGAPPPPNTNLALSKTMTNSGFNDVYGPGNANDGNTNTYWESVNNSFPQWLQVDLGSSTTVGRIVLTLPASWGARTQTLSVSGSANGSTFSTIVGSASYTFDPNTGNTVTISFNPTSQRYLRLNFTANTGWPAGQASEFEVFAS